MSNILNPSFRQDDLGAILSSSLGTENIGPYHPEPISEESGGLATIFTTAATDGRASRYVRSIDARSGGRRRRLAVGSATLAACAALGVLAWMR